MAKGYISPVLTVGGSIAGASFSRGAIIPSDKKAMSISRAPSITTGGAIVPTATVAGTISSGPS